MAYTGFSNYSELNGQKRLRVAQKEAAQRGADYAAYRDEWNDASEKNYTPVTPLNLDIELASSCNLRCTMCHQSTEKNPFIGVMKKEMAFHCIDQAAQLSIPAIKLSWRGEPTLNPHLAEIAEYAKNSGILDVQINTNGTPKKAGHLLDAVKHLDRIIFSIDGFTANTYEKIRRGGDFELLIRNVHRVLTIRGASKTPYIRVQMVRQPGNEHEVKEFISYWKNFVDDVRISDVMNRNGEGQMMAGTQKIVGRRRCPQPFTRLVVSDKGLIYACCSDWKETYLLGDIMKDNLVDVWNSSKLKLLRTMMETNQHDCIEMCRNCPVKESYVFG